MRVWLVCAFTLMANVWGGQAQASPTYQVEIFAGHATGGDGTPFNTLVNTFDAEWSYYMTGGGIGGTNIVYPAMAPGGVLNDAWYPYGSPDDGSGFGAVLTGWFTVYTARDYVFATYSDDGSRLYVGDTPVVFNDGDHESQWSVGTLYLTPGTYKAVVNFYENGSGPSGVTACIDPGAVPTEAPVPVPSTMILLGSGLLGLAGFRRNLKN